MLRQQLVVLLTNYCPADSIIALANAEKNDNIHNVKIVVVVPDESLITKEHCDKGVNWAEMNVYFVVPGGTTTLDPGVNYEPIESLQWLTLETDIEGDYGIDATGCFKKNETRSESGF
uniref:Uncharacterized protein n=1 Tax=Acrobeloides nanus TaxID=290746 RepID=A0A914E730_9BILA